MPDAPPVAFAPVAGDLPLVLILGSFPGERSLRDQQYYAHPQNAFWPIMGELVGAGPELPYEKRLERLRRCGIALWDALHACRRQGSGDQAIERGSEQPRDLSTFARRFPSLRRVQFPSGFSR